MVGLFWKLTWVKLEETASCGGEPLLLGAPTAAIKKINGKVNVHCPKEGTYSFTEKLKKYNNLISHCSIYFQNEHPEPFVPFTLLFF